MCGRFVALRNIEQLKQYFPIDEAKCEASANYNVAPTQQVLAITNQNDSNLLDRYHWGLVPLINGTKNYAKRQMVSGLFF